MRRVSIIGNAPAARALRTLIARDDLLVPGDSRLHDIQITVEEGVDPRVVIDSIDNAFERQVVTHIRQVRWTEDGSLAHRAGVLIPAERSSDTTRRDRMSILVPAGDVRESFAVEHGIYRALLDAVRPTHEAQPGARQARGWRRWLLLMLLLLLPTIAHAQVRQPSGAQHVVCDSGCGSPPATADASVFTAASTTVTPVAGVYNDAVADMTSGTYGAFRLTAKRAIHFNLRNAAGAEVGTSGSPLYVQFGSVPHVVVDTAPTTAVTGTFWQATQPVSLASMPSTPVTGTFWQATQPVNGTLTPSDVTANPTTAVPSESFLMGWDPTGAVWNRLRLDLSFINLESAPSSALFTSALLKGIDTANGNQWIPLQVRQNTHTLQIDCTVNSSTSACATSANQTNGTQKTQIVDGSGNVIAATTNALNVNVTSGNVTANAGTNLNTSALALDATLTGRTQKTQLTDGTRDGTVKAGSTLPAATDTAIVVTTRDAVTVTGTVTTTPPSNASTNIAQIAGTTADTNSGTKSAGTLRVVLATDQPALTNKLLVTPDSVALPANQSVNVSQINAVTPLMGNGVTGTGSPRVTIASDNTAFAVNATPPTLTKGTQGATGFSTQDLKDAGRVAKSFYANAVASGTTGTETLITLTQSSGTGLVGSAASYTITNGKTFRIQQIVVGSRGNATATTQITTFNLRVNTGGACIVTSTPIVMGIATATPATASAWDRAQFTIPDGYEIAGNGTVALCLSANAVFVTNAPTWFVNLIGYEY